MNDQAMAPQHVWNLEIVSTKGLIGTIIVKLINTHDSKDCGKRLV